MSPFPPMIIIMSNLLVILQSALLQLREWGDDMAIKGGLHARQEREVIFHARAAEIQFFTLTPFIN
jgi:hypothetical protein